MSSRICHDIISPLGAIGNGVELLELSPNPPTEEMALISDSLRNATARIRLFRVAFGTASPGDAISHTEIRETLDLLNAGSRVRLDWVPAEPLPRLDARAVLLAMLCLETALPRGGTVTASADGVGYLVRASHDVLDLDPALWAPIARMEAPEVSGRSVHFALLPGAIVDAGRSLSVSHTAREVTIRF